MAKKKSVKLEEDVKKLKKSGKSAKKTKGKRTSGSKMRLVVKTFITFLILAVLSYVLFVASGTEFYIELFGVLAIFLGFICVALLIVILTLWFRRIFRR